MACQGCSCNTDDSALHQLVGTTINCEPRPHVQSMVWATDDVGMSVLLGPVQTEDDRGTENAAVGLGTCYKTPGEAKHAEFGSTDLIQAQGYKVDVLMAAYGEKEEWDAEEYCEKNGQPEDVLLRDGSYFGTNLHPYETVFFPADRGVADKTLDDFTKWHQKRRLTSWDTCKKRKH